jgi:hypothetical protein
MKKQLAVVLMFDAEDHFEQREVTQWLTDIMTLEMRNAPEGIWQRVPYVSSMRLVEVQV